MKSVEDIYGLATLDDIVKELTRNEANDNFAALKKQFNPKEHDVFDQTKRPDKIIQKKTVEVTRIAFNFQKKIVGSAVSFLFANQVSIQSQKLDESGTQLKAMIEHILDKNKSYSFNRKLARTLFKETEVAEYWYPVEDENFWKETNVNSKVRLRCQLFCQSKGDKLYPYFNEYGDMIAFSRAYKIKVEGKEIQHLDVFTSKFIATYKKEDDGWKELKKAANLIGKIPIVYYSQEEAEWEDVQSEIDRIEKLVSNFGDTNDYFGSPMIKLKGTVTGLPDKGESGKVITLSENGEADYLTWNQAPEAIKTEYEILRSQVYSGTSTPNLSFDNLKNLGNISGITLKLMFLDAHLKAQNKLEIFDEAFARRMSILKSYCGNIKSALKSAVDKTNIWFVITPFLPENTKELYENLSMLTGGKQLLSQKTAIGMTGIVDDTENEFEEIKKDSISNIAESFV